jgi:hypothetical protein
MQHSDFLPASQPLLWDSKSCASWLAEVPMADPRLACNAFIGLLAALEDAPPRHLAYLDILETLRPSIETSQEELARRYVGRPLPLGHAERATFDKVCDLWHALMSAYRRLAHAAVRKSGSELSARLPLLGQRAIRCMGLLLHEHLRAKLEPEPRHWQLLNHLYADAEARGCAAAEVDIGSTRHPRATSCQATYARVLLFALANPYGMNAKSCALTWRIAAQLARKVELRTAAEAEAGSYAIELTADTGPAWLSAGARGDGIRRLQTRGLGRTLQRRMQKLASGTQPAELGLPRDCSAQTTAQIFAELRLAWAEPPRVRGFPRRRATAPVELASGFDAIHFALSGRLFEPADDIWSYSRQQADRMDIFRHGGAHTEAALRARAGLAAENWEAIDESASGFRLKRGSAGARLAQSQLVALKISGAKQFMLCELRWLMFGLDAALTAGMKNLPGLPHAAAIRNVRTSPLVQEKFHQAFVLPAAQDAPASLVLPLGWHQPERLLELKCDDTVTRVRLGELLGRGHDYDRARFSFPD